MITLAETFLSPRYKWIHCLNNNCFDWLNNKADTSVILHVWAKHHYKVCFTPGGSEAPLTESSEQSTAGVSSRVQHSPVLLFLPSQHPSCSHTGKGAPRCGAGCPPAATAAQLSGARGSPVKYVNFAEDLFCALSWNSAHALGKQSFLRGTKPRNEEMKNLQWQRDVDETLAVRQRAPLSGSVHLRHVAVPEEEAEFGGRWHKRRDWKWLSDSFRTEQSSS